MSEIPCLPVGAASALLEAASSTRNRKRDQGIVAFLLDTGARRSELVHFVATLDYDGERRIAWIGRGDTRRGVRLGSTVAHFIGGVPAPEDGGEVVTARTVHELLKRLGSRLGLGTA